MAKPIGVPSAAWLFVALVPMLAVLPALPARAGELLPPPRRAAILAVADPRAQALYERGMQFYEARQFGPALDLFVQAARMGDPHAQNMVGNMYADGDGVARDFARAAPWFRMSAAQGNRWGEYSLGLFYMRGLGGLQEDQQMAARLFQASAEQGLVNAQGELGLAYEFGAGVPRDRRMALHWLDKAAPHWGRAHWYADWLRRPDTPQFQTVEELDSYINSKVLAGNGFGQRPGGGYRPPPGQVWNGHGYGPANPVTGAPCQPLLHNC